MSVVGENNVVRIIDEHDLKDHIKAKILESI